jgi:hypothetical protein
VRKPGSDRQPERGRLTRSSEAPALHDIIVQPNRDRVFGLPDSGGPLAKPAPLTHYCAVNASGGFMAILQSASSRFGLLLATALSVAMLSSASEAYTPEQQQACSDDAFRLCGPAIPDVDRVTACMVSKKEQLSPGCRVFFRPDPEPDAGAPLSIRPATAKKRHGAKPHRRRPQ